MADDFAIDVGANGQAQSTSSGTIDDHSLDTLESSPSTPLSHDSLADSTDGEKTGDTESVPGAAILTTLEKTIGCRVLVYHSAETPLEKGDLRPLHVLLDEMGKQDRAALIIQSPGGNADAAHALSSLLNDYISELHIYVVSYAASAATILALAANKLWMGPGSELSPVDPQVPVDPRMLVPTATPRRGEESASFGDPVPIPAHVIRDFLELTGVMDTADGGYPRQKVNPERLEHLFKPLNPWILGWYERADKVSRLYARDALVNHLLRVQRSELSVPDREELADKITHTLLDHYASHETGIQRNEARRIGIPVEDCPDEIWTALQSQRDWYDDVIREQNVGRVLETLDNVHVIPANPERRCSHCQELHEVHGKHFNHCPSCGKAFEQRCEQCDRLLRTGWSYCPACGTSAPTVHRDAEKSGAGSSGYVAP